MKGKQILIAFSVLLLLSAYFYFFSIKKKQDEQKTKDDAVTLFPGMNKDGITGVTIKTKDAVIVMKKTGNDWDLTEPVKAPADKSVIDAVVSRFVPAKAGRKIEGALLADYGLNTPPVYVSFFTGDNKTETLYMSELTPSGELTYAMKSGDNSNVYLVAKELRADCDKAQKDFRYKGLLRLTEQNVTRIEVNLKDKKYVLEKRDNEWHVVLPQEKHAKKERISTMISTLNNSSIKEFLPVSNAAKYGLKGRAETVTVYEGTTVNTIFFGTHVTGTAVSVFARSSMQDGVVEVPGYVYEGIPKLDEVLNKQLIIFNRDNIQKVSMKFKEKSFTAERNTAGKKPEWVFKEWKGLDRKLQKSTDISGVLNSVYSGEYKIAIENPDKNKETMEYGLSPEAAEITLWEAGGKKAGTLIFGGKVKGGEDVYIKVPERNTVYVVAPGAIKTTGVE